jgi:hypothetical protein
MEIIANSVLIGFLRRWASFLYNIPASIVHLANMAQMTTYLRD